METARVRYTRRHIPAELVEKILLNLPLKSVLRFSAVSKPWNDMILGSEFAKRYRCREMMVLRLYSSDQKSLACPISAVSAEQATPFSLPFKAACSYSDVSCCELRCVELGNTLCLYNPSTGAHRKLPPPSCSPRIGASVCATSISVFVYGLGYDSAADDYKIFKAHRNLNGETEVYSLRSDSWRKVVDSRKKIVACISGAAATRHYSVYFHTHKGVFVGGALHWLVQSYWTDETRLESDISLLSFDVSTEEYRKKAAPSLPERLRRQPCSTDRMDVCVLRGRMCVFVNSCEHRFVVWAMMEDCSWKKDMEIDCSNIYPLRYAFLKPFYFYDCHGNPVKAVTSCTDIRKMFIYGDEEGEIVEMKKFGSSSSSSNYGVVDSFTYVESLVSPFPNGLTTNSIHTEVVEVEVEVERELLRNTVYMSTEGRCDSTDNKWAAYRGKYPNPTYGEYNLIAFFLLKLCVEDENFDEEASNSWIRFKKRLRRPNLRPLLLEHLRQVRGSKGYDVETFIDFTVSPHWEVFSAFGLFVPRSLEDEKFCDEAMAASKFAIGIINAHMGLMESGNRYEFVSVEKLVSTTTDILLLTFTAKEISTADLEIFQAMVNSTPSSFQLKEWKFKPICFS